MKDLVTVVAVLGLVVVGFFAVTKDQVVKVESDLAGFSGNEPLVRLTTQAGFAQGGQFTIATTASAMTLGPRDLADNAVISIKSMGAGQAALALTFPSSTTWSGLDAPGVVQSWIIDNTDTNAATTTTLTAGAGVDIDGTGANDDVLNGGTAGLLSCWRLPSTETLANGVRCIVQEMVDAG